MRKPKICIVRGCKDPHSSKGFCKKHYTAWRRKLILDDGSFTEAYQPRPEYERCKYPECGTTTIKGHGLCNKHYKWATRGIISMETCEAKDEDWLTRHNLQIKIVNGKRFGLKRHSCKIIGCTNTKLKGRGLCGYHYSRYANGFMTENGERMAKPIVSYREDFKCTIPGCTITHKESRMVKGLCRHHYGQYLNGYIDFNGFQLKEKKRIRSYKGVKCKYIQCKRQARVNNFCTKHWDHVQKGLISEKGFKLKDPKIVSNKGRVCKADGCNEPAKVKHYCTTHYNQIRHNGFVGNVFKNVGHNCSVDGCTKPASALTLCDMHYSRYRKYGQTEIPKDKYINKHRICKVDGCDKPSHSKGMCVTHYGRFLKYGHTNIVRVFRVDQKCKAPNCNKPVISQGHCSAHLYRLQKYGCYDLPPKIQKYCQVENCQEPHLARGFCKNHYASLVRRAKNGIRTSETEASSAN